MDEQSLRQAEALRIGAMLSGDVGALDALLDDRLSYTHSDATVDDKASYLEKVRTRHYRYEEIRIAGLRITPLAGAAMLTGEMAGRVWVGEKLVVMDNRFLAVSALADGAWRLLAYQPTPIRR